MSCFRQLTDDNQRPTNNKQPTAGSNQQSQLSWKMIIDLTHPLVPGIPIWSGDPALELRTTATIASESWYLQTIALGEQTGTHIGVGAHMNAGEISIDKLPVDLLIRPAVVIDVR